MAGMWFGYLSFHEGVLCIGLFLVYHPGELHVFIHLYEYVMINYCSWDANIVLYLVFVRFLDV